MLEYNASEDCIIERDFVMITSSSKWNLILIYITILTETNISNAITKPILIYFFSGTGFNLVAFLFIEIYIEKNIRINVKNCSIHFIKIYIIYVNVNKQKPAFC